MAYLFSANEPQMAEVCWKYVHIDDKFNKFSISTAKYYLKEKLLNQINAYKHLKHLKYLKHLWDNQCHIGVPFMTHQKFLTYLNFL